MSETAVIWKPFSVMEFSFALRALVHSAIGRSPSPSRCSGSGRGADECVRRYTNRLCQREAIAAAIIIFITSAAMNQYKPKYAAFANE